MIVKNKQLRGITIGTQFVAGISLLTASYFTTESNWATDVLKAAVHSEHSTINMTSNNLKPTIGC